MSPETPGIPPVSVQFEWDADEHARSITLTANQKPLFRVFRRFAGLLPLGVLGFTFALWGLTDASGLIAGLTMLPWFILTVFWYVLAAWTPRLATWRLKSRLVSRTEERTVSEEGLDVAGRLDATFVPWSAVVRVVETDEFVLFQCGDFRSHYIPKRALSAEALARLRGLVEGHVTGERRIRGGER